MNKEKVLLENLIASKKNIKRKIMEMKRDVIDSDNYYRDVFKPIIEPLSTRTEKNTLCNSQPTELKKIETICSINEDDDDELNSSFEHFFNNKRSTIKRYGMYYDKVSDSYKIGKHTITFSHGNLQLLDKYYPWTIGLWSLLCEKEPKKTTIKDIENYYNILKTTGVHLKEDGKPKTSRYHKWSVVVKPLYDRMKHEEKQLNEHIAKINNLRSPQINLTPIKDHLSSSNAKRSNVNDDTTMKNEPFYFNPEANSSMVTDPAVENMFNFTLTPQPKKGSGLYKDVIPQTQLVYYDDPNELVTRLNLLTSSQSVESIANELHRPARKIFPRRSVVTRFIDDLWQADLMDMQSHSRQNYGFKYILVVIDTYSKYVWVEALKNKTSKECTNGMFNILKKAHPKLLQTDNGTEFYNIQFQNLMKKYKIKHYSSYSVIKCSMAERVIQTLKNNIYKHFTATGTWNWYNTISKIMYNYNNTKHRTIKCTPNEARMDTNKIKFNTQFNDTLYKPKLKVNDKVRISKYKHIFSKGYTPNWTTEIFTVSKVLQTNPVTYQLKDGSDNIILGGFYEQEIKLTDFPDTFLVERIIKKVGNKMFVKWLGFDSSQNSWITSSDILK
ncbi:hypothetical protein AGLY_017107 [Aphis glycines]|uniref:Integrase catalytic domain-containing protein n=1 Tax=Aphis glycines TaxID=307491 RepID=A0A6G0SX32_APHGL|nr:hypothetical protein AGLY_017107 [Aphis glycines]